MAKISEEKKAKETKKEKTNKKEKKQKEKKTSYLKEVRSEMKKVTFPSAKEVVKYTFATICIVAFLVVFFLLLTALMSAIKEVF